MKRILMATDLSARSDRALERTVDLARRHDAELTIVHVVDEDLPASLADAQQTAAAQAIQAHVGTLDAGDGPDIKVATVLGRAYVDILQMSEQVEADLIVIGVHREHALKDMFRGTTAERVLRAGSVPVLLVKDRIAAPYGRVVVGVDFSVYSRRALEFAIDFVPGGEFHLVHAYDVPFKGFLYGKDSQKQISDTHRLKFEKLVETEMAAFLATLEGKAPRLEHVMQEGMVREVIHQQVRELNPDLLVIGTHGRTGVAHALLGSIAEDLLKSPPCDVLAVKAW